MPELKSNPLLSDIQNYVKQLELERGFADQTIIQKCLMLGEETGELFKAVRKSEGLVMDRKSEVGEVSDELADIIVFLCSIANRYNIDLEEAFRKKEEINKKRVWVKLEETE